MVSNNKQKQDTQAVTISLFKVGQVQNWWEWSILRTQWINSGGRLASGFSKDVLEEMNPGRGAASRGDSILDEGTKKNTVLFRPGQITTKPMLGRIYGSRGLHVFEGGAWQADCMSDGWRPEWDGAGEAFHRVRELSIHMGGRTRESDGWIWR